MSSQAAHTYISVIVTCHSEGILLHKTLASIERAATLLRSNNISYELIVHLDNPTREMLEYKPRIDKYFPGVKIYQNNFGDPGLSRDYCIQRANGTYIALIDGDDLMSENWLYAAFTALEAKPLGKYIAHSEMTVEFGGFNSIVQKYDYIDTDTDSLLNVWSARWNAIIFAPSSVLKAIGYPHNTPGYGYEDWLISCTFISEGIKNILIPETVMFVRRKEENSVWDNMRAARLVLPAHQLLSFEHIRSITLPKSFIPTSEEYMATKHLGKSGYIKERLKGTIKNTPVEHVSRRIYRKFQNRRDNNETVSVRSELPSWLLNEWQSIHTIEKKIFPSDEILGHTKIYHSITELHYRIGAAYKKAVDSTRFDKYDYILFVPWLIKGGADSFAINYANTIARYNQDKRVLVIATMQNGHPSAWRDKLDESIDFIPLNQIFDEFKLEHEHQNRILEQLIENSGASHLHVLNSILGYDFIKQHTNYLRGTSKKVIATSFSQSTDESGRIFGFSHTHVPEIYDLATFLTTDNSAVKNMWVSSYGFDEGKILVHRPVIDIDKCLKQIHGAPDPKQQKILWAARLAPEKLPLMIVDIAKLLPEITFDMYGKADPDFPTDFLRTLPPNVHYKGEFDGFFTIPTQDYSAYLYTSLFDGLPNSIVEASVAKLPIVASAVGGIPEHLSNSSGILVDDPSDYRAYAEALKKVLSDRAFAESLASNAYAKLSDGFDINSHAKAITDMLKRSDY